MPADAVSLSSTSPDLDSSDRDDRTVLTLTSVVGAESASLALTHFVGSRVCVAVSADILLAPNGWTAARLAINMLTRFVGEVEVRVVGALDRLTSERLTQQIELYRRIDTRPGHSLTWTAGTEHLDAPVVLCIGSEVSALVHSLLPSGSEHTTRIVALGFTGWRCHVAHLPSTDLPRVKLSSVVFGACAGVCFATAEIFKLLLLPCLESHRIRSFERRLTKDWRYDVWVQDRTTADIPSSAPDPMPMLEIKNVVQIGAGAVGNASAFTLIETPSITGVLPVIDFKKVDSKNLNRCLYFSEENLENDKTAVLESASRVGFEIAAINEPYSPRHGEVTQILLSTVDNNAVRHQMQESVPKYIVEGSTGETRLSVSVHTAIDGRTCLICKHPDRSLGLVRSVPLSIDEAMRRTGLPESVIRTGVAKGSTEITDSIIEQVRQHSAELAEFLLRSRQEGKDLCGALGDLRSLFGLKVGPREASIPFVSVLAGVLAAAEVVKLRMFESGVADVPLLDNAVELDLARDYARRARVSASYPAHTDCKFCVARKEEVRDVYGSKHELNEAWRGLSQ
jgi:hypothetical protein